MSESAEWVAQPAASDTEIPMIDLTPREREVAPARPRHADRALAADRVATPSSTSALAPPRDSSLVIELYRTVDTVVAVLILLTIFLIANSVRTPGGFDDFLVARVTIKNVLLLGAFAFLWQKMFFLFGLYDDRYRLTPKAEAVRVVLACTLGSACALAFPLLSKSGAFGYGVVAYAWLVTIGATLGARQLLRLATTSSNARAARHVLIVGSGPRAINVARTLRSRPEWGYRVVGFVDSNNSALADSPPTLGTLDQLESILMHRIVDEVMIALPIKSCYAEIQRAIQVCERVGVQSKFMADVFQTSLARPWYDQSDTFPVVTLKVVRDDHRLWIKRALDVVSTAAGLVVLAPILAAIAVAIKATSPGPVLFAQERFGLRKRRFKMYKFRTMVVDAPRLQAALEARNEAKGPVFKIKNDPRVTRVGRFLRRSSLDELPQLLNILRGDMSLVGPRPLPVRDVHLFDEAWLMRRFSVPPGLTGLWQVSGRSNLAFDDWMALDLQYIDQWSLVLDLQILAKTIPAVLKGTGAT